MSERIRTLCECAECKRGFPARDMYAHDGLGYCETCYVKTIERSPGPEEKAE